MWKARTKVSVRLKQRANKRSSAGIRRDKVR